MRQAPWGNTLQGLSKKTTRSYGPAQWINAVSPTLIEASPQYFPFFPGDIPVTMRHLEYGFRKCVFGAGTGQVIKVA